MFRHPFYTLISSFVISLISSGSLVESYVCGDSSQVANNPVIGILSMERFQNRQATTDSYIAASYVKFIESAGAQVVPLPLGKSDQYYSRLFYKLNGVLFPGGGVYFNQSDYTRVAHIFLTKALARNRSMLKKSKTKETKQFPVWGTCLGMEVIVYLMFNQTDSMFQCNHQDRQGSLQFELPENKLRSQTLLFRDASPSDINAFFQPNVTINYHSKCVPISDFSQDTVMGRHFRILATETDSDDREHVSIFEGKRQPIFGVQFHPEKPMFEFAKTRTQRNIPHSANSIRVGQYLANRFVENARNNQHCFDSHKELDQLLIYNHNPQYVGNLPRNRFEQIYLFPMGK